jgi:hypothetical protein
MVEGYDPERCFRFITGGGFGGCNYAVPMVDTDFDFKSVNQVEVVIAPNM